MVLAEAGFTVFGVDRDLKALCAAGALVASAGSQLRAWCADLTETPLPTSRFDVIVVTRYLQRALFPSLMEALAPAGVLLYETFTVFQRAHGGGPTSSDHLLEPGELVRAFDRLEPLYYEEVAAPEAVARLAARRRVRFS